jgi:hypothetical protein
MSGLGRKNSMGRCRCDDPLPQLSAAGSGENEKENLSVCQRCFLSFSLPSSHPSHTNLQESRAPHRKQPKSTESQRRALFVLFPLEFGIGDLTLSAQWILTPNSILFPTKPAASVKSHRIEKRSVFLLFVMNCNVIRQLCIGLWPPEFILSIYGELKAEG